MLKYEKTNSQVMMKCRIDAFRCLSRVLHSVTEQSSTIAVLFVFNITPKTSCYILADEMFLVPLFAACFIGFYTSVWHFCGFVDYLSFQHFNWNWNRTNVNFLKFPINNLKRSSVANMKKLEKVNIFLKGFIMPDHRCVHWALSYSIC